MSQSGAYERGQSEALGFVLIIGIVITGALLIAAIGAIALGETEESLTEDRAEAILTQLDSKAGTVALGESSSQTVSLGSDRRGEFSLEEGNGQMRIEVVNRTAGEEEWNETFTLGAIVWDGANSRLAYQGGGVWRADASGGQMVSPPEFHFRDATLTLPMVTISGDNVLGAETTVEREFISTEFPREDISNPLEEHRVFITVTSEFYRGWADYFEARTEGSVEVNPDEETARVELVSRIGETYVDGAVAGQTIDGTLNFQANPAHPCRNSNSPPQEYFDGYNSADLEEGETYCDQYDQDTVESGGALVFGGDIEGQAAASQVQADLVAGGDINWFHRQRLHGDVRVIGGFDETVEDGQRLAEDEAGLPPRTYGIEQIDHIETVPPIDLAIEQTVSEARSTLDETTFSAGDEVTPGVYFTTDFEITESEQLLFNTTDGDISLIVNDTISLRNADILIEGDGEVDIFVGGNDAAENDMHLDSSTVFAPRNDASKLTVLSHSDFTATLDSSQFTGVIYAPGEAGSDAEVEIFGGANVFGALVTGDVTIGNPGGGTVHFDRSLGQQTVVPPDFGIARLTYLHISENHITFD